MKDFMRLLVSAAGKGANIARIIRKDEGLFALLVEEKVGIEKNQRFVQDFKTLADVLIQESLRWEISKKYPEISDNIFGEETNTFTNGDGETVTISIQETEEETAKLLGRVMGGQSTGAKLLAEEIHKEIGNDVDSEFVSVPQPEKDFVDNWENVGIWIDPIDGTNEYIKGVDNADKNDDSDKIYEGGLHCVTVLIGAFDLQSGQVFAGVINQPFWKLEDTQRWKGRHWWGLCVKDQRICSPLVPQKSSKIADGGKTKPIIILSASEEPSIVNKLNKQFNLVHAAGAGYKLLCVVMGLADLYVLSRDSTHYWDTCGPHGILKAQGGDVLNFDGKKDAKSLTYEIDEEGLKQKFKNREGIVVYRNKHVLELFNSSI